MDESALETIVEILEEKLHGEDAPEGAMNLSELDGFLACLAVGPQDIPESEWMPAVFGLTPLEFAARSYDPVLIDAIRAYRNEVAEDLRDPDAPDYMALLFAAPDGGHDGVPWTCGFVAGIAMREKAWLPLMTSRQAHLTLPLLAFEPEDFDTGPDVLSPEEPALLRAHAMEVLSAMVAGVNRYWRNRERKAAGLPRVPAKPRQAAAKVGRNDPCSCGSGKKFKTCCAR